MLTFRLMQSGDIPGILKLWEEYSGWGGITAQQFQDWYVNTPYGSCITVVAVNEREEIVAQKVFMPREMYIAGKKQSVLRVMAPIVADEARRSNMLDPNHPIVSLFKCGMEAAKTAGYAMIYTLPARGWAAWLRAFPRFGLPPWKLTSFSCLQFELTKAIAHRASGAPELEVREVDALGAEWESLIGVNDQIAFTKAPKWANWKHANERKLAFYLDGIPWGYLILKRDNSLVLDAHAQSTAALGQLIRYVLNNGISSGLDQLTVMYTPFWADLLHSDQNYKIDYTFVYGMLPLQEKFDHLLTPANCNLFPGD